MKALQHFMTPQGQCTIYLTTSRQDGADFWTLMGPWFASREVAESLGEGMYDHEAMVWAVAVIKDRAVGFGGIDLSHADKHALLNYGFIAEPCRHTGIYRRLIEARVKVIEQDTDCPLIKALCTPLSAPVLAKLGFVERSHRGRYAWFVKELKR
jgi:GNAT superfamily N-acetyltransferase